MSYSPWGHKESDMTVQLTYYFQSCINLAKKKERKVSQKSEPGCGQNVSGE